MISRAWVADSGNPSLPPLKGGGEGCCQTAARAALEGMDFNPLGGMDFNPLEGMES